MSDFTPGPWKVDVDQVFDDEGKILADCKWSYADITLRKANARLIAAAPDLLEACKSSLLILRASRADNFAHTAEFKTQIGYRITMLEKVIAKAEGRE